MLWGCCSVLCAPLDQLGAGKCHAHRSLLEAPGGVQRAAKGVDVCVVAVKADLEGQQEKEHTGFASYQFCQPQTTLDLNVKTATASLTPQLINT